MAELRAYLRGHIGWCGASDPLMRAWREANGRLLNWLLAESRERYAHLLRLAAKLKMRIILIRHGLTRANEKHLYCGSSDLPLSEAGIKGINERAAKGIYPPPDGCELYTSGLLRAEQTFSLIYGAAVHKTDERLRELDFGDFELLTYDELKDKPAYIKWISATTK